MDRFTELHERYESLQRQISEADFLISRAEFEGSNRPDLVAHRDDMTREFRSIADEYYDLRRARGLSTGGLVRSPDGRWLPPSD
ncbi:MAG TPA: hypothetical protein VL294_12235 [Pseudolysinimonas sp.]|jgi:hypothetical protein|nr:hypothetical protein [Pseudolysinimonas sp.]